MLHMFCYHSSSDFCELVHFLPVELGQKSGRSQDAAGPSRLNFSCQVHGFFDFFWM